MHRKQSLHLKTRQNDLVSFWNSITEQPGKLQYSRDHFSNLLPSQVTLCLRKFASHSWILPGDCLYRHFLLNDASKAASVIPNDSEKALISWIQATNSSLTERIAKNSIGVPRKVSLKSSRTAANRQLPWQLLFFLIGGTLGRTRENISSWGGRGRYRTEVIYYKTKLVFYTDMLSIYLENNVSHNCLLRV